MTSRLAQLIPLPSNGLAPTTITVAITPTTKMRGTIVVESGGAFGGAGREGAATDARRGNGYGGRRADHRRARTNGAGGGRSGY